MRSWLRRLIGYVFLLVGVVFGFAGLIALSSRREGGSWDWGWPETFVLLAAAVVVILGLVLLRTERLGGRSTRR